MPSLLISVYIIADTSTSSNFLTKSTAEILDCSTQPSVAILPSLTSMPKAIFPGYFSHASITSSGFFKAIVPIISLLIPAFIQKSIVSKFLTPPPS